MLLLRRRSLALSQFVEPALIVVQHVHRHAFPLAVFLPRQPALPVLPDDRFDFFPCCSCVSCHASIFEAFRAPFNMVSSYAYVAHRRRCAHFRILRRQQPAQGTVSEVSRLCALRDVLQVAAAIVHVARLVVQPSVLSLGSQLLERAVAGIIVHTFRPTSRANLAADTAQPIEAAHSVRKGNSTIRSDNA